MLKLPTVVGWPVIYDYHKWERGLHMFLEPLSKCSCRFTNVFFIPLNPGTLGSVDLPSFCVMIFGVHQEVLDGSTSFEIYLSPMLVTDVLDTHWALLCMVLWDGCCSSLVVLVCTCWCFWKSYPDCCLWPGCLQKACSHLILYLCSKLDAGINGIDML